MDGSEPDGAERQACDGKQRRGSHGGQSQGTDLDAARTPILLGRPQPKLRDSRA
jgi:hypothetical protein